MGQRANSLFMYFKCQKTTWTRSLHRPYLHILAGLASANVIACTKFAELGRGVGVGSPEDRRRWKGGGSVATAAMMALVFRACAVSRGSPWNANKEMALISSELIKLLHGSPTGEREKARSERGTDTSQGKTCLSIAGLRKRATIREASLPGWASSENRQNSSAEVLSCATHCLN